MPAQGRHGDAARRADRLAVEDQFAAIAIEQMQHQPCQRRFAAARFTDDAECLAFEQRERHAVHGTNARGLAAAAHMEVLGQIARDQQRLRGAADIARVGRHAAHSRTSIAERIPSLTRLKQIEVTKIAAPGSAQDSGAT